MNFIILLINLFHNLQHLTYFTKHPNLITNSNTILSENQLELLLEH